MDGKSCHEVNVRVKMECLDLDLELYTKLITLTPKFVIINKLGDSLLVTQLDSEQYLILTPSMRMPYLWERADGK
jgi:hypothetical protein